jgi:hypothetical protein
VSHGWLIGRGSSKALPFPAHSKVVEAQDERLCERARQRQPELGRVDEWHVVVDQEVVEADRRDRPAKRLERHAVVPRGEA